MSRRWTWGVLFLLAVAGMGLAIEWLATPPPVATLAPQPAAAAMETVSAQPDPPGEERAMARIRGKVDADPLAALEALRGAEAEFARGRGADERSYLKMRALANLQQIGAMRAEADDFFRRFPNSPWGERVWSYTGVRPRPRARPQ